MKHLFASAALLALSAGTAFAADPVGDWLVKEGYAHIRIDNCFGKLWGIVAWEKTPGIDTENPDPAKKSRPTLGIPILMGLKQTKPNKWEGEIYNSQNGKMYSANISMVDDNTLELEGCLFTNFLCQAQKWTRVTTPPLNAPPLPPLPTKSGTAPTAPTKANPAAKGASPIPVISDVCARIPAESATPPAKGATK
jgi:uncharacterized protein (DUF2147 family)